MTKSAFEEPGCKKRLEAGEVLVGTFVQTPHPVVCEFIGGNFGLDFLCLEGEHSAMGPEKNMEKAVARLNAIPGVDCPTPEGGFYLFPDFSAHESSSAALAERLLRGGVAIAMGASFGSRGEGCARLLFSAHWADVDKAIVRIENALSTAG